MEAIRPRARILCVEDHADTREVVFALLSQQGFEVTCAESPYQALDLIQNSPRFDLYIVDTWLPGMSGLDLCNRLRRFDSDIPIVFFTAAGSEADRERAFECGAHAYLVKPVDTDRLAAKVSRILSDTRNRKVKAQASI